MWNMIIHSCHIYYIFSFYHVGEKEIIKQKNPLHKWYDWIMENDFLLVCESGLETLL